MFISVVFLIIVCKNTSNFGDGEQWCLWNIVQMLLLNILAHCVREIRDTAMYVALVDRSASAIKTM